MMRKRIIAVHLLNDRSGSPLVLSEVIHALTQDGDEVILYTATPGEDGFLSGLRDVSYRPIFYKWSRNKVVTLALFIYSQLVLFLRLMFALKKTDTLYVNTLLPFGAALAGYVRGVRIIYHVHETSIRPAILRRFLTIVADKTADRIIFVSAYLRDQFSFGLSRTMVIHNCLPEAYVKKAAASVRPAMEPFTVCMLCSLKAYKGVFHFVSVARKMPGMQFELVLNASVADVEEFRSSVQPPDNCNLYPAQSDTTRFYSRAHVVLNLSDPQRWVETFGMTLLEGMSHGLPVISPTRGGVLEVVKDGVNGFTIDCFDEDRICDALAMLQHDGSAYAAMADAALATAGKFGSTTFYQSVLRAVKLGAKMGNAVTDIPEMTLG